MAGTPRALNDPSPENSDLFRWIKKSVGPHLRHHFAKEVLDARQRKKDLHFYDAEQAAARASCRTLRETFDAARGRREYLQLPRTDDVLLKVIAGSSCPLARLMQTSRDEIVDIIIESGLEVYNPRVIWGEASAKTVLRTGRFNIEQAEAHGMTVKNMKPQIMIWDARDPGAGAPLRYL